MEDVEKSKLGFNEDTLNSPDVVDGIIDEVESRVSDWCLLVKDGKVDASEVNGGLRLTVTKLDGFISIKDVGRSRLLVNLDNKLGSIGRVDIGWLNLVIIIPDSIVSSLEAETLDSLDVSGLRFEVIKKEPLDTINEDTSILGVNGGNKVFEYGVEIFVVFFKLASDNEVSKSDCTSDDILEVTLLNVIALDWLCSKDNEDKYEVGVGLLESNDVAKRSLLDTVKPERLGSNAIV